MTTRRLPIIPFLGLVAALTAPASAHRGPALLYVAVPRNTIQVFDATKHDPKPTASIMINGPQGLATDAAGNLYVCNAFPYFLTEYARGSTEPTFQFHEPDVSSVAVAVSASGTIYVAGNQHRDGVLAEFQAGNAYPVRSSFGPFPTGGPLGLALDSRGNLYVLYGRYGDRTRVVEYAPDLAPIRTVDLPARDPKTIVIDGDGHLVIAADGKIFVFRPGDQRPVRVFKNVGSPGALAFDPTHRLLYEADQFSNVVYAWSWPAMQMVDFFTHDLQLPLGMTRASTNSVECDHGGR